MFSFGVDRMAKEPVAKKLFFSCILRVLSNNNKTNKNQFKNCWRKKNTEVKKWNLEKLLWGSQGEMFNKGIFHCNFLCVKLCQGNGQEIVAFFKTLKSILLPCNFLSYPFAFHNCCLWKISFFFLLFV